MSRLELYVQGWRESAADLRALTTELDEDAWALPTDCPGWSVRDVLAHLVAIEEHLAGIDTGSSDVVGASPVVEPEWTHEGVQARRGRSVADLLTDLDTALTAREQQLASELADADPHGVPPRVPAGLPWDWDTLLRNRTIDMWVHGQDIRRAVGRPGGMHNVGAAVAFATFTSSLPYVLGRKVRPPVGTSVVWEVTGPQCATVAVRIDESRRAVQLPAPPAEPAARLAMDTETFVALAAGRLDPATAPVQVSGDADLARQTMTAMVVTP